MVPVLLFLLSLYHLQTTTVSTILDSTKYDLNNLLENSDEQNSMQLPPELNDDDLFASTSTLAPLYSNEDNTQHIPIITSDHDRTDVTFKEPIAGISIDYAKNKLRLSFQKHQRQRLRKLYDLEEERRRKSLEHNFMRFGKREKEEIPRVNSIEYEFSEPDALQRYERSQGARDARGDNFMRFGRAPKDFMRFGRAPAMAADFMRFGRSPNQDFMRFGKSQADFMRFGRSGTDNYMRFGRNPSHDFMRFGRNPKHDFMRFGRAQKAQRSADKQVMSFGRNAADFIRFGRTPPPEVTELPHNFMRFGKSETKEANANQTMPLLQKSEIREAAKILHKSEEGGDESNPVDKAIKVLFKKHRAEAAERSRETMKSNEDADDNVEQFDDNLAMDYGFNAN